MLERNTQIRARQLITLEREVLRQSLELPVKISNQLVDFGRWSETRYFWRRYNDRGSCLLRKTAVHVAGEGDLLWVRHGTVRDKQQ